MILYAVILLLVFLFSGVCLYLALFSSRQKDEGFISVPVLIILLPLAMFIPLGSLLGMIGIYRTDITLFIIFVISIAFAFRKVDKQGLDAGFKKIGNHSLALLKDWKRLVALFLMLIILLFFLAVYFRPAAYYLGGFDPGIYVNSGINLSKGGSVFFHDEVVRDLGYEKARRYLGMFSINPLGLNITNQFDGVMASQFYPGMSVLYAGAYDILGFKSFLAVQPFIALFALLALFIFVRKIFGFPTAFIATFLYGINIITIWFGRYPVSEPLTVLLLSGSFYLFIRFTETEAPVFAAWGGLLGAAALITRPDTAIAIVMMFAYGYYRKFFDLILKKEWLYYLTLIAGLLFSFVYAFFFTGGYMHGVFISFLGVSLRKENAFLKASLMVCLLLIAAFLAWKVIDKRKEIRKWLGKLNLPVRFLPTVLAGLALALIIFQLMIRPARPFAFLSPQDNSLLRLGWYFAPLELGWDFLQSLPPVLNFLLLKFGIFLAAFSVVFLIEKSRDEKKWLFNIIWLPYAILYLQDLRIDATHIWLNRRYLMFILFALIVSVVYLLVSIHKSFKGKWGYLTKGLAVILILFYLGSFLLGSSIIWRFREMKGLGADLQALDEKLDGAGFIIIDGVVPYPLRPLLLPLQDQFSRRVGILKNRSAHIDSLPEVCEELAARYGDVYYLAPGVGAGDRIPGFWEYKGFNRFDMPMLEKPDLHDYRPPTRIISYGMDTHIYRYFSEKVYAEKSYDVDIGGSDDIYLSGEWYGKESTGDMTFRWSGPFAVINLSNTVRGDAIEIRMAQGPKYKAMKDYKTKIRIEGGAALEVKPAYDWTVYRLPLDKDRKLNGPLRVIIESTPWELTDPRTREARELGLMVDWVRVIPAGESSLPMKTKLIE